MKKLLLIVNPRAGKLAARSALFDIITALADYMVTVRITAAPGEATGIARQAAEEGDFDLVVCCGGDGTLNEVINGVLLSGKALPVGYLPAGSTNDFANSMKMPTDLIRGAEGICKTETPVELDVGRFNGSRFFTYIASFGAFTATSYTVPQNIKNTLGHFAYVLAGIKDVTAIKPYGVSGFTSRHTFEGDYIFGAVCNSFSVGGVIKLDRTVVNLSDGQFEVLFVKQPKNPAQLNKILWGLINTDFSDHEVFEFFKADKITLKMAAGVNWSLDGEFAEGSTTVEIENIPSAIQLWYRPEDQKGM